MDKRFQTEVMNAFARRLKKAREDAGFDTAKRFAEALGVEQNRYRHWERGTAQPDIAMLTRICRLLDVEPNDLLPLALKRSRPTTESNTNAA
jgi:transcriptional regulator with XRE-family HTH domain